ncbi:MULTISPECIES: hypothetical protein [Xenorhabdus]|uniref:Uncharacterized protein n=4 Tax=Xenorhabdus TaxID=626 RepID=A0A0B6X403_XENBV|nr:MULTISPECIES: hypothetical protein [Xenorhabdus]MDC9622437.1 hypothetical protein [Xenorhabdus aichiensis]CDM88542.1 conserved protein of unknown function [Xenorhabdus bovienii]
MMSLDDKIYAEIGQLLYNSAPDDAKKIIMDTELSPEGDCCQFKYDYINSADEMNWFSPQENDGLTNERIRELLVSLRQFFVENIHLKQPPHWSGCIVTVDVEKMKLNVDFKYED